nr:VOC family protein [Woeseiaceae bacterium]
MRIRVTLGILVLAFASVHAYGADKQTTTDDYDGVYIKRPAIVVSDLERALHLWRDVLGMTVDGINKEKPDSLAYDLFDVPKTATLRFATLNAGARQERTYGMLEISGMDVPRLSGIRRAGVVVNANGRWSEIRAAVQDMGLTLLREKVLVTKDQGTGIETGFVDWDGNLIVVYQLPG